MLFTLLDDDNYNGIPVAIPSLLQRSAPARRPVHAHIQRHDQNHHRNNHPALSDVLNHLLSNHLKSEEMEIAEEKNKYKLMLDVQQFAPNEVSVKVVDDFVVVEGSHEDKEDEHGWISRKFTRRYQIPKEWDIDQITSKLSSDGVLTILVPPKEQAKGAGERVIKVQHTGKPAVQERPQKMEEKKATE